MKKKLLILPIIAMSLIACDNDDQLAVEQKTQTADVSTVMVKDGQVLTSIHIN